MHDARARLQSRLSRFVGVGRRDLAAAQRSAASFYCCVRSLCSLSSMRHSSVHTITRNQLFTRFWTDWSRANENQVREIALFKVFSCATFQICVMPFQNIFNHSFSSHSAVSVGNRISFRSNFLSISPFYSSFSTLSASSSESQNFWA